MFFDLLEPVVGPLHSKNNILLFLAIEIHQRLTYLGEDEHFFWRADRNDAAHSARQWSCC